MLAALELIEIGDHVMFANNCFVGDSDHRYDDPTKPVTWQGFEPRGPVRIGSNCWFGVGCVVTGGVQIGERCVIGANSVVTRDLPGGVIAAGAPAKVIREIEFKQSLGGRPGPFLKWARAQTPPRDRAGPRRLRHRGARGDRGRPPDRRARTRSGPARGSCSPQTLCRRSPTW